MSKKQTVGSEDDLLSLRMRIGTAASRAAENLRGLVETRDPLDVLRKLKFEKCGAHPLEMYPMNIMEQLNQTFTYLVSLDGVAHLLKRHADHAPFVLNLGTRCGYDIESEDGEVVAEVFAAVRPSNNDKLAEDSQRVHNADARHKYVFFMSPGVAPGERQSAYDDVTVVAVPSATTRPDKADRRTGPRPADDWRGVGCERAGMKYEDIEFLFDYVASARRFERSAYLNRRTGKSYLTSEFGDSDELPDDLEENDDYLDIPHRNDLDLGQNLVFEFAEQRLPSAIDRVYGFFQHAGAYARFRDLLEQNGLLDDWYKYEADRSRAAILEWCKRNNVELQG